MVMMLYFLIRTASRTVGTWHSIGDVLPYFVATFSTAIAMGACVELMVNDRQRRLLATVQPT
jgi:hypothetical protein